MTKETNKKIYEMNDEEIDIFIKQHLPVKKIEKDKYGEVFTDPELINKMLDLFPKNVWTNPDLKWLDPATGAGFFMILVYQRLMKGLEKWETNTTKRSKHIITDMLHMVEINQKNCDICKNLFGKSAQIVCSDFLNDGIFKNMSFDCIVGNPPFQDDYGLSKSGKRINGGKSKLYERIFLKSYSMLNSGGYISFLVPDNMFSGNGSESYKVILENFVPFVSFNFSNQSYFPGIQQNICYFILQKGSNKNNNKNKNLLTTIENSTSQFQLKLEDRPVNPIRNWNSHTEQLIKKYVSNERNNVKYNRGSNLKSYKSFNKSFNLNKTKKRGINYPIIYTLNKTLSTNNPKLASGFGQKKAIIFAISVDLAFKMDYTGKYGAGPNTFYIPFKTISEGKRIEQFLKSDDYKKLALSTKTSRQYLKIAFIEHLKLTKISNGVTKKNKTRKHYN